MNYDKMFSELKYDGILDYQTSEKIIDQVVGQEHAKHIVKLAAKNKRNVLLIGAPGIGKSMLGKAYAEIQPSEGGCDIIAKPNPNDFHSPNIVIVDAGKAEEAISDYIKNTKNKNWIGFFSQNIFLIILLAIFAKIIFLDDFSTNSLLLLALVYISHNTLKAFKGERKEEVKDDFKVLVHSEKQIFIDATGQADNGLFGDVLHDPYQSGELAIPPHKRLIPGAVHKANGGTLYIDEIGTLKYSTQIKLLSVLQDRKYPISGNTEGSASSSIRTEPLPCNFALVAAGNRETVDLLHPAFRSRFQGYGYEVVLPEETVEDSNYQRGIVQFVAQEVKKQEIRLEFTKDAIWALLDISRMLAKPFQSVTLRFRELGGIVRRSIDIANNDEGGEVNFTHIYTSFFISSLETIDDKVISKIFTNLLRSKFSKYPTLAELNSAIRSVFLSNGVSQELEIVELSDSYIPALHSLNNGLSGSTKAEISFERLQQHILELNLSKGGSLIHDITMAKKHVRASHIDIYELISWVANSTLIRGKIFICFVLKDDFSLGIPHFLYRKLRQISWIGHSNDLVLLPHIEEQKYDIITESNVPIISAKNLGLLLAKILELHSK